MQNWDYEKTKEFVINKFGESQLTLITPCLNSLVHRKIYASYHFHEYKKISHEHIESQLSGNAMLNLINLAFNDDLLSINGVLPRIEANIIACLQSLHCITDTLSHVICYAVGLNLGKNPLIEKNITAREVLKLLNKQENFSYVKEQLNTIILNQEFLYLSALVNYSKHRSIIKPDFNLDFRDDEKIPYSFVFPEFIYKGEKYSNRTIESFLEPFYSWFSPSLVNCGNALNDALAK